MSMWLSKKKKPELVGLCSELGLRTDGLKKLELEQNLKQYLYQHQETLFTNPTFSDYYDTLARSPHKKSSPPVFVNPVDPILPSGSKRDRKQSARYIPVLKSSRASESVEPEPLNVNVTSITDHINGIPDESNRKHIDNSEESEPDNSRRTGSSTPVPPRRSARLFHQVQSPSAQLLPLPDTPAAHNIPLPPSPAVVADLVEASAHDLRARINAYIYDNLTPVVSRRVHSTQKFLSNVVSVAALVHLFEFTTLLYNLVPASYLVTIPPLSAGSAVAITSTPMTLKLPDLFTVLEGSRFWGPVSAWAIASVLAPGLVGYFVNLTRSPTARKAGGGYICDPLTFALAKGVLGWILFYRRTVSTEGLKTVEEAVGREVLVLVGSMIVGLVGLWEGLMTQ